MRLDKKGDPRVGMTGGSYGGGIQLSTAGIDRRIDAIVPVVAWHSLETSLYKDRTFKQGWNTLLYGIGFANATNGGLGGGPAGVQTGGLDPHITSAYNSAQATGQLSAEDEQWFRDRGPGNATISKIRAPTLLVGGTVDTLFPLDEDAQDLQAPEAPRHAREDVLVLRRPRAVRGGQRRRAGRRAGRGLDPRQRRRRPAPRGRQRCLARALPEGRQERGHRPRLRVPLGRRQVPRGPAVPGPPRQARQGQRVGHARDRTRRDLGRRHGGDRGGQRRDQRARHRPQGEPAARAAEGHDHLQGHRHARHDARVRAAREPRPRRGRGQPVGPRPREARRQAAHDLPPARPDRLHREGRRALPASARGRLGHLGRAARHGHAERVADQRRAAGGQPQRPRRPRQALQHRAQVHRRGPPEAQQADRQRPRAPPRQARGPLWRRRQVAGASASPARPRASRSSGSCSS